MSAIIQKRGYLIILLAFIPARAGNAQFVGGTRKFPIYGNLEFLTFGLSLKARRTAVLALPTERGQRTDVWMGDEDVVEALSG